MSIFSNFIKGLKKSFDGKDHLREINKCDICGKPSFSKWCQWCELEFKYRSQRK
jgi:hypothetical protein